jgi:hypothetical protein
VCKRKRWIDLDCPHEICDRSRIVPKAKKGDASIVVRVGTTGVDVQHGTKIGEREINLPILR